MNAINTRRPIMDEIRALILQDLRPIEIMDRLYVPLHDVMNERARMKRDGIELSDLRWRQIEAAHERWKVFVTLAREGKDFHQIIDIMGISATSGQSILKRCREHGMLPDGFKVPGSGWKKPTQHDPGEGDHQEPPDRSDGLPLGNVAGRFQDDPRAVWECRNFDYAAATRFGLSARAKAADARLSYGVGSRLAAGD